MDNDVLQPNNPNAAHQAFLSEISKDLVALDNIADTMERLSEKIARHFEVAWCNFGELINNGETGISYYGWHAAHVPSMKGTYRMPDLWTPEQAASHIAGEITVVNDTQNDTRLYARAYAALGIGSYIAVPLARDGEFKFMHCIMDTQPRQWQDHEIALMQELVLRIWTRLERARAEKALQRSEEKYRALFNTIDNGLAIVELERDARGKITDMIYREANTSFEKHTGLTNTIGKRASELLPEMEKVFVDTIQHVADTGEPSRKEDYVPDLDRWYDVLHARVGGPGSPFIAAVFKDVTARKYLEQRQEFLLKLSDRLRPLASPVAIQTVAADLLGEQLKANQCHYGETIGDYVHINHSYGNGLPPMTGRFHHHHFGERLVAGYRSGKIQVCYNTSTDVTITEAERLVLASAHIGAYVAVPLVKGGEWVATLAVHNIKPRQWKQHEIDLVQEVAERTWAAVERAKVEAALRISEDKYRSLFNSIDEGFCIIEMVYNDTGKAINYRFMEVNKAYERHTGQPTPTGKLANEIAPQTEPYWLQIYDMVARTGEPVHFEHYHEASRRWYESYASRVGGPASRQVAVIFSDVTERKHREQQQEYLLKLSDALRQLSDPIEIQRTAARVAGEYLQVDRAFYCEFSADGGEYYIADNYLSPGFPLRVGRFPISTFPGMIRLFSRGETVVINNIQDAPAWSNEEKERAMAARIMAVIAVPLIKGGRLVAQLSVHQGQPRDWTFNEFIILQETAERTWAAVERSQAEEALRERERQLKQLLKQRDEFIGIASHELKTPVTSIKAYAEIVQERLEEAGNEDDSELLSRLNTQIDRLTILINHLLDTTRISEGQLQLTFETIDINELLYERIEEIKRTTNHTFKLQTQAVQPVIADRERIGQVITNLLSNAIKYSPKGTTITIATLLEKHGITVSVQDEGYGIPDKDIKRIFEKFFRVTANNMNTFPGMGLGLYITAQIIQKHGGAIWVQSKEGEGTVFSFMLPYHNHRPL
jgi:PAS domain S-box-containing protein